MKIKNYKNKRKNYIYFEIIKIKLEKKPLLNTA